MRAIWSGEIGFGLVTVPVKLYAATKDLTPQFHLIHKVCGTRVQVVRRCPKCDRDIPWDEIEKGYEVDTGEYARFSKKEIVDLEADESKGLLEIVEFVSPKEVDPAYIEKSYWVAPAGKNARSFLLLRTVLDRMHEVAVAKVAIRTRTRLGLLRPRDGFFSLDLIRYADELVDAKELTAPIEKAPTDKELALAKTLVDQLTARFDPKKHPDEYRLKVAALVDEKVSAKKVTRDAGEGGRGSAGAGTVIDLSELLTRSLDARKSRSTKAARAKPARAPARRGGSHR